MSFHHYTPLVRLKSILSDGVIKPATKWIDPGEKPAVWFSSMKNYDPVAFKLREGASGLYTMSWDEMKSHGATRITVSDETAALTWQQWRKLSGVRSKTAKSLEDSALISGSNVAYWRACFEPVPASKWLSIEIWADEQWAPFKY